MKLMALTIWQPWASLIAMGTKPYEFRKWPAPVRFVDQRIVIHAGARPVRREEIIDLIERISGDDGPPPVNAAALPFLLDLLARFNAMHSSQKPGKTVLPLGAGLCSAVLRQPIRATELFAADSDRVDEHVFAWPLTDIEQFAEPIPARGAQGFWPWAPEMDREIGT